METAARPVAVATDADRAIATDVAVLLRRPSALIRLTVDDLRDALYSGSYAWDPGVWHSPAAGRQAGRECAICLGGARLAGALGFSPSLSVGPSHPGLAEGEQALMYALDLFRVGAVNEAFVELGLASRFDEGPGGETGLRFNRPMPKVSPSREPGASRPNVADPLETVGPLCDALVALAADLEQGGF